MRSNELKFLHKSFISELENINVNSTLELLEYTGNGDNAIKLKFLLLRKLKKLGLHKDEKSQITKIIEEIDASPNLLQQLKLETNYSVSTQIQSASNIDSAKLSKTKSSPRKKRINKLFQIDGKYSIEGSNSPINENHTFDEMVIESIDKICKNGIINAERTSPSDLLVSIFSEVIYPSITDSESYHKDLQFIELFNEVGELAGVSNTVDFSRNLGDIEERWNKFEDTRERISKSFAARIMTTTGNFRYNNLFKDLLRSKIKRTKE